MRKITFVAISIMLATLFAVTSSAQRGGCCQSVVGPEYPAVMLGLVGYDEHGCRDGDTWLGLEPCEAVQPTPVPTVVPTAVPTPTPPPGDGGLWGLITEWASKFTIWKGDAGSVAKIIAVLMTFLGVIQALKKMLESAAKWEWLLKLIPQLAVVFNFLAHGIGPMILNAAVTGGTMLIAAVQDGALSAGEVIAILVAVLGVDLIYRFIRKYLFPKVA